MKLYDVLGHLKKQVDDDLTHQLIDEKHHWHGAVISPESRLADPSHGTTSRFIMGAGLILLAATEQPEVYPDIDKDILLERITLAAKYMLTAQRSSGLIDLQSTNYDSSPDTGFVMQLFCALFDLTKDDPYFQTLNETLELFLRRATPGVRDGGFHTPNHRWVIVSALVQAKALFPDLEVQPALDLYLNEGFDCDADGAYLERSVGIYDTVSNNALMFYALHGQREDKKQEALEAVKKNLNFNLYLFHADGTAETGLSTRRDFGTRNIASNLISSYVFAYHLLKEERFLSAALWIWEKMIAEQAKPLLWLSYVLLKFPEPDAVKANIPQNYQCFYPDNNIWRLRQGDLSATAYGGRDHLMNLSFGQAVIQSVQITQAYFGTGRFVNDEFKPSSNSPIEFDEQDKQAADVGFVMKSFGKQKPRRPGYDLPRGKPVDKHGWDDYNQERSYRAVPLPESSLSVSLEKQTMMLHYQTQDGLDQVASQFSFDLVAGCIWETASGLFKTVAGQAILLKQGSARAIYGTDVIEFSSGHFEQGYLNMRNSSSIPEGCCRIIMSFLTPIDFKLRLNFYKGLNHGAFKPLIE